MRKCYRNPNRMHRLDRISGNYDLTTNGGDTYHGVQSSTSSRVSEGRRRILRETGQHVVKACLAREIDPCKKWQKEDHAIRGTPKSKSLNKISAARPRWCPL